VCEFFVTVLACLLVGGNTFTILPKNQFNFFISGSTFQIKNIFTIYYYLLLLLSTTTYWKSHSEYIVVAASTLFTESCSP
jgi:hypothetical protein